MAECSFCGERLVPGTGFLFVKKDGTPLFFCSRKCEKNLLLLKRKPSSTKWTALFQEAKKGSKAEKKKKVRPEKPGKEKKERKKKKKRVRRKKKAKK